HEQSPEAQGERQEGDEQQAPADRHRKTYPTPRSVSTASGASMSRSFRRMRATYASSVLSCTIAPWGQAAATSSDRRRTTPRRAASAARRRNSVGVRRARRSPAATAWPAGSSATPAGPSA